MTSLQRLHWAGLAVVLLMIVPSTGLAQSSLAAPPIVRLLSKVWITTTDGREVAGFVTKQTPAEIYVQVLGVDARIPSDEIQRIQRRVDFASARRGMMIGSITGAALATAMLVKSDNRPHCDGCWPLTVVETTVVVGLASGMGGCLGRAIGLVRDRTHEKRELIYQRATRPHPTVTIAPIVAPNAAMVHGQIRW